MKKVNQSSMDKFFAALAWKFFAAIDLPNYGSHQHEIQGIAALRNLLGGESHSKHRVLWRVFDEDGALSIEMEDNFTWYNAREKNPHRSPEWRFYYRYEEPLQHAKPGDLLLATKLKEVLRRRDGIDVVLYVIPQESALFSQLLWLLRIPAQSRANSLSLSTLKDRPISFLQQEVVQRLDPELDTSWIAIGEDIESAIKQWFGDAFYNPDYENFPSTSEFATFGQKFLDVDVINDPDTAIERVLEIETAAFQMMERAAVGRRLREDPTIGMDVDAFIQFSLRVQNRRKARRGRSLEHHLSFVFNRWNLPFEEQVATEHRSTVDFLFPSLQRYVELSSPIEYGAVTLGAKTTLKDRWRQVLAEAEKMHRRHLFTLETGISSSQTAEMGRNNLSLVVPQSAHSSFIDPGTEILTLKMFCDYVKKSVS